MRLVACLGQPSSQDKSGCLNKAKLKQIFDKADNPIKCPQQSCGAPVDDSIGQNRLEAIAIDILEAITVTLGSVRSNGTCNSLAHG